MRALKEEMRALTEEAALKGQELCAAPSTAPAPSEASSLGSERPAKFPRPVIRPRDPSPSPAAPASSEGDVQEGWFPSPTSKEAASEPRPASAQGAVQRDSTAQVGFGDLVPGPSEAAKVGFGDLVPGPSEAAPAAQVGFGDLTDQAGFFPEPPPEQRPVEPAEVPPGLFGDVQSPYTSDAPAAAARSQAASPGRPARPRLCERASSEGEELAHSMRLRSSTRVARAGADNALGHSRTTGDIVDGVEGLPATPSGN